MTGLKPGKYYPEISHLFFVDDSLNFCKASTDEVWSLRNLLKIYEITSGQTVNFGKPALLFSPNVSEELRTVLTNILSIPVGKYLGISSSSSRKMGEDFKAVTQRVWKTLQGWKSNLFSIGGKEVLIKVWQRPSPHI